MQTNDRRTILFYYIDSPRPLPSKDAHPLFTALYFAFSATLSWKMSLQEKRRSPQRVYKTLEIETKTPPWLPQQTYLQARFKFQIA